MPLPPLKSVEEYERESGEEIQRLDVGPLPPVFEPFEFWEWTGSDVNAPSFYYFPPAPAPAVPVETPVETMPTTRVTAPRLATTGGGALLAIIGTWLFLEAYTRWIEPRKRRRH